MFDGIQELTYKIGYDDLIYYFKNDTALVQVEAGNTSENLLNEIKQITYSLYQEKEITKKVYNNIMNSITL